MRSKGVGGMDYLSGSREQAAHPQRHVAVMVAIGVLLALSWSFAPGGSSHAAEAQSADVMFLMDGSGSISADDWYIQREGIASALDDHGSFPSDGTVAVGVTQWTTSAELEIPLTVIDGETARAALQEQIRGLVQNGGGTEPSTGIAAATEHFRASGRGSADWVDCLSSDGSGGSLTTAVQSAKDAGVDRLSVLAVEDGSAFTAQDARNYYGPATFGGGTVTVARNAAEFAALVNAACRGREVTVEAIEVTQGVQDWAGSVPLVADRRTDVRVFVSDDHDGAVTGQLEGVDAAGSPLPGSPLAPTNAGARIDAPSDVAAERGDLSRSLNFRLPGSWTKSGTITLKTAFPGGQVCSEAIPPVDACSAKITFGDGLDLDVRYVTFDVLGAGRPSTSDAVEQAARTAAAMPVANLDFEIDESGKRYWTPPSAQTVLNDLADMKMQDGCDPYLGCRTVYVGLINKLGGNAGGMASDIPGDVAVSSISSTASTTSFGYGYIRTPHEIGHTRGLPHAVNSSAPQKDSTYKWGYCGEAAALDTADFPYHGAGHGGVTGALLGPVGDRDREVWGLDRHLIGIHPGAAVVNPQSVFEMMSYCSGLGVGRWPSKATWQQLINTPDPIFDPGPASSLPSVITVADRLVVSGVLDGDSGPSIGPVLEIGQDTTVASPIVGTHEIVVYGKDGEVAATALFTPVEASPDIAEGGEGAAPVHMFAAALPWTPGAQLSRLTVGPVGGPVALDVRASAQDPTVSFLAPLAGDSLGEGPYRIAWAASDPDGDDLTASIAYSPDAGETWTTLATGVSETSIEVPAGGLQQSDNASIRVIVSDGLRSSTARVDGLVVPNNPPQVTITSPTGDAAAFSGVQSILMSATVTDPDTGNPDPVAWTSSIDGFLGTGEIELLASDLSEGEHTLTATATDDFGATGTAAVTVTVTRVPVLGPLDEDGDGIEDAQDQCQGSDLASDLPPREWKKNRYWQDANGSFVDPNGRDSGFNLADTDGCTASQIISAGSFGGGHNRFGLSLSALTSWVERPAGP